MESNSVNHQKTKFAKIITTICCLLKEFRPLKYFSLVQKLIKVGRIFVRVSYIKSAKSEREGPPDIMSGPAAVKFF